MSEDFVTQLRLQLREAAEREGRRGPARRVARRASSQQLWRPALALAALALAALALVSVASHLGHRQPTPAHRGLHVLQRQQFLNVGSGLWPAFGSVWVEDESNGQLLRVDPGTRRVIARIPVGGWYGRAGGGFSFDFSAGAVWAVNSRAVVKIDPATNRVSARVPMPAFGIIAGRDALWVLTAAGMRRMDPHSGALGRSVTLTRAGFQPDGIATDGRNIYVSRADGTLLVFDAHTGVRRPTPGVEVDGNAVAASRGTVILATAKGVSALNASTARTLWTVDLARNTPARVVLSRGLVWVEGADAAGNDRLWRLDAATGRITASLVLNDFGAPGLAVVGERVWVVSSNGVLQIIG